MPLGGLIHRRGIEGATAPGRQDVARYERFPSQSMGGEMEEATDEKVRWAADTLCFPVIRQAEIRTPEPISRPLHDPLCSLEHCSSSPIKGGRASPETLFPGTN